MKNEKIAQALSEVRDDYIAQAACPKKKKRRTLAWVASVAALLAVVLIAGAVMHPFGTPPASSGPVLNFTEPSGTGKNPSTEPPVTPAIRGLLASPVYPKMARRPVDKDAYDLDLTRAWEQSLAAQRNQPEGYADSLRGFWADGIPALLETDGTGNAVCAPMNVYMALAMLAETTGGNSREQILSLLGAQDITALRTQAQQMWNAHYCDDGVSTCTLGSSLWLDEAYRFNQDTVDTLASAYYASVFRGDLDSAEMVGSLRAWLNEQTHGLLSEYVQNIEVPELAQMILATTVYYRARWQSGFEFNPEANAEGIFHSPTGDTPVTFMRQTLRGYYRGDNFSAVGLPLDDGSTMWLILPDEGVATQDVLANEQAISLMSSRETPACIDATVHLSVPKFDVSRNADIIKTLQKLGVTDVFSAQTADFSPLGTGDFPTYLDQVKHAARVAVDEEGIEAAAYTVMMLAGAAPPPELNVNLTFDRPFVFAVSSHDSLPLFVGVVNQP